ncbi:MAG: sulfotransferase [Thermoleophilia bacterium]|nr:sulfotransferase [Thermoleophilia bacterium]
MTPPVIVLGVSRSGTTLLRVMLDRHSELAMPDESFFIPQLARRHGERPDPARFVDDLRRLPTLRDWRVDPEAVAHRLRHGVSLGEAIAAIYYVYAADRGKRRWGDKTPAYMQHLRLLERLWPHALFVHLVRDGRDAALSLLAMPEGVATRTWAHPRTAADFACQWTTEVRAAHALARRVGARYLEVRYEQLVAAPEEALRRICEHLGLAFEPAMLEYAGTVDVSTKPHQQRLRRPPTPGVRDWRAQMKRADVLAFEAIAGDVLAELGYELLHAAHAAGPGPRARGRLARYLALRAAWNAAASAVQRSPLWLRRHPRLV